MHRLENDQGVSTALDADRSSLLRCADRSESPEPRTTTHCVLRLGPALRLRCASLPGTAMARRYPQAISETEHQ